jgi:small subunit ribosomal protein S21
VDRGGAFWYRPGAGELPPKLRRFAVPTIRRSANTADEARVQVLVRDNNVDQALRALKKKMQREGIFREMKLRGHYEKPSRRRRARRPRPSAAPQADPQEDAARGLLPMKPKPAPRGFGRPGAPPRPGAPAAPAAAAPAFR